MEELTGFARILNEYQKDAIKYNSALQGVLRVLQNPHLELSDQIDKIENITREALNVDSFGVDLGPNPR